MKYHSFNNESINSSFGIFSNNDESEESEKFKPIENYEDYIISCKNNFQVQQEKISNSYSDIKFYLSTFEKKYNIDINDFLSCFEIFEELYNFFQNCIELLDKFSKLNDYTQTLISNYKYKIKALKEFQELINNYQENIKIKDNNINQLKNEYKKLNDDYIELFNQSQKKDNQLNSNNNDDNIKNLLEKIEFLNIEKNNLNNKINDYKFQLNYNQKNIKTNYILKNLKANNFHIIN